MFLFYVLLIALAAGFTGALTGTGGALVLTPCLTLLGLPIKEVIGISTISVIATSVSGGSVFLRRGLVNIKLGLFQEIFTIVGAAFGAYLSLHSPSPLLYILFGALLLSIGGLQLFHASHQKDFQSIKPPPADNPVSRFLELRASYYDESVQQIIAYTPHRPLWGGTAMVGAGFISGMFGIGAGVFKVMIHELILGMPAKASTTTSHFIMAITSLSGAIVFVAAGIVSVPFTGMAVLGTTVGAWAGGRFLVRQTDYVIRMAFLALLFIFASYMVIRGVSVLL